MVKVSTSWIDVTPSYPIHILGHSMRKEKSKGVHDAILFVLLWIFVDDREFLFVAVDLLGVDYEFTNEVRDKITQKIKIQQDQIHISATHTHSGPLINHRDSTKQYDKQYRKTIIEKLVEEAIQSHERAKPVEKIICSTGFSEGYYGNRNDKNWFGDQHIDFLKFIDDKGNVIAALLNMACHATVLSPIEYQLSADLLGAIRKKVNDKLQIMPLVNNGAAGDMSTRLYRQGNDFSELERVSSGIVNQIMNFKNQQILSLSSPKVDTFQYISETIFNEKEANATLQNLKKQLPTTTDFDQRKWLLSEIQDYEERLHMKRVKMIFDTTIIDMGDLQMLILPCELSAALGAELKSHSKAKICMIFGYSNGQTTYVVEKKQFEKGYGGAVTKLVMGKAEEYKDMILQHMKIKEDENA